MYGAIPSLPQYAFMVQLSLKKAQGQLYLLQNAFFHANLCSFLFWFSLEFMKDF
jgi:hypothetical protein